MSKKKAKPEFRTSLVGGVLLLALVAAGASQARVHVFERKGILDEAEKARRLGVERQDVARRGKIVSADGKVLAQSEDSYTIGLDYARLPDSPGFWLALSEATGIPEVELRRPAQEGAKSRQWPDPLSPEQAERVRNVQKAWGADGISRHRVLRRVYPLGTAATGVTGVVREGLAPTGLESSLDSALKGEDGASTGFVDRTGAFLILNPELARSRQDGQDVVLTLQSELQVSAAQAVRAAVEAHQATSGSAIVMDPETGNILAMANWPSDDPEGPPREGAGFNPNTMGAYEPGSTFKPLTLARALDLGETTPTERIYSNGKMKLSSDVTITCSSNSGDTGWKEAIAKSCNISAATWALRCGWTSMHDFLLELGLLDKTEIGLPLERAGDFDENDGGKRIQLATLGFGQSVIATPVALASAFCALANGGVRMHPRLIASIGGEETEVQEAGSMFSADVADQVLEFMEATVHEDYGTAASLRIPGYRLAGKTGTAQKPNPRTGKYEGGGYVSSFVGMVPAKDPKVVILVMIDDPKGAHYGAVVAGPAFREIALRAIRFYDLPPTEPFEDTQPLKAVVKEGPR